MPPGRERAAVRVLEALVGAGYRPTVYRIPYHPGGSDSEEEDLN